MKERLWIKLKVEEIIRDLSNPLSEEDVKYGWNVANQKFMLDFYRSLLKEFDMKKPYLDKEEYGGIAIRMDYAGINGGDLDQRGVEISSLILKYNKRHKLANFYRKIKEKVLGMGKGQSLEGDRD